MKRLVLKNQKISWFVVVEVAIVERLVLGIVGFVLEELAHANFEGFEPEIVLGQDLLQESLFVDKVATFLEFVVAVKLELVLEIEH